MNTTTTEAANARLSRFCPSTGPGRFALGHGYHLAQAGEAYHVTQAGTDTGCHFRIQDGDIEALVGRVLAFRSTANKNIS